MNKEFIAKRVYQLRSNEGISARKLSLDLGLSNSYMLQVESGSKVPSFEVLLKLSEYFNLSLAEFFSEDDATGDPEESKLLASFRRLNNADKQRVVVMVDALAENRATLRQDHEVSMIE